ncbi:MAG TPA: hypothetical protein ENL20_12960 [Candidatus Cloacimonetes bacterium]|nr:hypothetical protein [Candidatus Cloacimonadota bacterium]
MIDLVGSISKKAGLEEKQIKQLQLAVEETCLNVIKYAFDPDETDLIFPILSSCNIQHFCFLFEKSQN